MLNIQNEIDTLKSWPSCAHISPNYLATLLENIACARCVNIGVFSSSKEVEDEAAELKYCADPTISQITFAINHGSYMETVVIHQTVYKNMCSQLYLSKSLKVQRGIFFTDENRTWFKEIGEWA